VASPQGARSPQRIIRKKTWIVVLSSHLKPRAYQVFRYASWAYLILAALFTLVMLNDVIEVEGGVRLISGTPWSPQTIPSLILNAAAHLLPPILLGALNTLAVVRHTFGVE